MHGLGNAFEIVFLRKRLLCKLVSLPLSCKLSLPHPSHSCLSPQPLVSVSTFPSLSPLSASLKICNSFQLPGGCCLLGALQMPWVREEVEDWQTDGPLADPGGYQGADVHSFARYRKICKEKSQIFSFSSGGGGCFFLSPLADNSTRRCLQERRKQFCFVDSSIS